MLRKEQIDLILAKKYWPFTVYLHTFPNNRKYVGITCNSLKERWNGGEGYKRNKSMYQAIQDCGWNNIQHKVVKANLCEFDAHTLEKELIAKWDLTNPTKGYNLSKGFLPNQCYKKIALIVNEDAGTIIDCYHNLLEIRNSLYIDKYLASVLAKLYEDILINKSLQNNRKLITKVCDICDIRNNVVDFVKIFHTLLNKEFNIHWLSEDVLCVE